MSVYPPKSQIEFLKLNLQKPGILPFSVKNFSMLLTSGNVLEIIEDHGFSLVVTIICLIYFLYK